VKAKDGDHKPELESIVADLSPAETELRQATRLASRGGRSERDCGLSSAPGREIEELLPRAQAFADAQICAALRQLNLEANVAALRPGAVETDVRKVFLSNFVKNFPNVKGRTLCLVLDKAEIPVLPQWARDANSRLWTDCWAHAATKNLVRKYLSAERRKALNLITGA
jgi:hypothetical protein